MQKKGVGKIRALKADHLEDTVTESSFSSKKY